jgi:hypothetical protein
MVDRDLPDLHEGAVDIADQQRALTLATCGTAFDLQPIGAAAEPDLVVVVQVRPHVQGRQVYLAIRTIVDQQMRAAP